MSKNPENKGWEQNRNNETRPSIRYVRQIEGEGICLYVGITDELKGNMLARDFINMHQANIWDSIGVNEGLQDDWRRPEGIFKTASSALKPGGILDLQGYFLNPDDVDMLDELATNYSLDKISSEEIAEQEEPIYIRMTWQKREKEKLRIKRSVSLLLSTLMER